MQKVESKRNKPKGLPVLILLGLYPLLLSAFTPSTNINPTNTPDSPLSTPLVMETLSSTVESPKSSGLALGYYTGTQESLDALKAASAALDIVSADVYGVQLDGSIVGQDEFGVVGYDRELGIQTYACISNWNSDPAVNDFDPALAKAAILTHKDEVIKQLVELAQSGGFEGINIDFESLAYGEELDAARADFTVFIDELAAALHAVGKKLIISVPGKTADSMEDTWSYPFDLAALGQDADYLQLMSYDQHGPWGEPGPVSGADWVEEVVVYTSSIVEPAKLLIGLPAYGYDWDLSAPNPDGESFAAGSFSWKDIPDLLDKPGSLPAWDPASQSPSLTYMEEGHSHVAWYENEESLHAKAALVEQYGLAGISVWSLGQEDVHFWQAVVR
jgi:spore germination protein